MSPTDFHGLPGFLYFVFASLFLKRFKPSRNVSTHVAEPSAAFIITISVSPIPLNDTSIDRCKANMEAKASANDILRSVSRVAEVL